MHRRTFIRSAAVTATAAAAGLAATACTGDAEDPATAGAGDPTGAADDVGAGGDAAGGGDAAIPAPEDQTLAVQAASLEFLTGRERHVAFGLTELDRTPLAEDRAVEVYLRAVAGAPEEQGRILAGPLQATFAPPAETGQGIYYVRTDLEEAGLLEIVAVSEGEAGAAAIQVVDPQDSRVRDPETQEPVIPGSAAISAVTPTTADDQGVFALCTQDPPCGMHETSLDEALAAGRPVALLFATPAYCQTVVCGPSVATLDAVRQAGDFGDTAFIHCEIFAEEPTGTTVAETPLIDAVLRWGLPTEPWLFTIGADGTIVDRLDGPMPEPIVRQLVEGLGA
jgi:hypothetical protein